MDAGFFLGTLFSVKSAVVLATSFLTCLVIIATERLHRARTARHENVAAVQALHRSPVPRIGGLGVIAGISAAIFMGPFGLHGVLLFAAVALPMVALGLEEDFGGTASPRERLMAVALSTAIAMALLGMWIVRINVPVLDWALSSAPLAIGFTLLLVVGTSHAFNIIDGLNGLSMGFASLAALSLAALAAEVGDFELAALILFLLPAFAGFLAWNFPHGRLFLGDAGAYSTGFLMVWLGIVLLHRHPEISPWAVFLVLSWPIAETLMSMGRRVLRRESIATADTGHVHHLVYRSLCAQWPKLRGGQANPIAAVLVLVPATAPMVVAMAMPLTAGPAEVVLMLSLFALLAVVLQIIVTGHEQRSMP